MMYFCPTCGNELPFESHGAGFAFKCRVCPYMYKPDKMVVDTTYYTSKVDKNDDIMGGSEAWKNAAKTQERCPKCSHPEAYFHQLQTRSADEAMTEFYKCCNVICSHSWRVNN